MCVCVCVIYVCICISQPVLRQGDTPSFTYNIEDEESIICTCRHTTPDRLRSGKVLKYVYMSTIVSSKLNPSEQSVVDKV
jgi:hypothetical protein